MNVAVIGAGAIGSLVAGYLKRAGESVSLIGRPAFVEAIQKNGLQISGVRGDFITQIDSFEHVRGIPDLTILAVKTQDIHSALNGNKRFLGDSVIITTQNGVRAETIISGCIPRDRIISSIVMFGATCLEPARVVHNFEGTWIIGKISGGNDETVVRAQAVLNKIFPTEITGSLAGMKYLKIFVNANNCIPAILGLSMQEAFSDFIMSQISISLWKEGLDVVTRSGRELISLPGFPLERLTKLTSMPAHEAAGIFSGIMVNLSKEPLDGSILQSIRRGRPSEIDYINGEFIRLAEEHNLSAPLNAKLVDLVHQVEKTQRFFSRQELIAETANLIQ